MGAFPYCRVAERERRFVWCSQEQFVGGHGSYKDEWSVSSPLIGCHRHLRCLIVPVYLATEFALHKQRLGERALSRTAARFAHLKVYS